MIYPILESIIYTGLCWMLIGYIDAYFSPLVASSAHNVVLGIWVFLFLVRSIVPIIRLRRRKIMVTDQRVILHNAAIRGNWESIPLQDVRDVARKRKDIYLAVAGHDRSIYLPKVPKAKKVVEVLTQLIRVHQAPAPATF